MSRFSMGGATMAGFVWNWLNREWLGAIRKGDARAVVRLLGEGYPKRGQKETLQEWFQHLGRGGFDSQRSDEMAGALAAGGCVNGMQGRLLIELIRSGRPGCLSLVRAFIAGGEDAYASAWGLPAAFMFSPDPAIRPYLRELAKRVPLRIIRASGDDWIEHAGRVMPPSRLAGFVDGLDESAPNRSLLRRFLSARWQTEKDCVVAFVEDAGAWGAREELVMMLAALRIPEGTKASPEIESSFVRWLSVVEGERALTPSLLVPSAMFVTKVLPLAAELGLVVEGDIPQPPEINASDMHCLVIPVGEAPIRLCLAENFMRLRVHQDRQTLVARIGSSVSSRRGSSP